MLAVKDLEPWIRYDDGEREICDIACVGNDFPKHSNTSPKDGAYIGVCHANSIASAGAPMLKESSTGFKLLTWYGIYLTCMERLEKIVDFELQIEIAEQTSVLRLSDRNYKGLQS